MRTFARADFLAAQEAWAEGRFSPEWEPYRRRAAAAGFIWPPTGDRYDSWEDDEPSQRAILIRAIRETPALLGRCIDRSRGWSGVIRLLVAERDGMREDANLRARNDEWERKDDPTPQEATQALGAIIGRLRDSLP